MWKQALVCLAVGAGVMLAAGCGGPDYSGTYVSDPDNIEIGINRFVLDVKKADKGYNMEVHKAYYDSKVEKGEGSVYYIGHPWGGPAKQSISNNVITCDFNYDNFNQVKIAEPSKDNKNTLTYTDKNSAGMFPGSLSVDKDGNLMDVTGNITGMKEAKFIKQKEFSLDKVKQELKDAMTESLNKHYVYENKYEKSTIQSLTFNDATPEDKKSKKK